MRATGLLNSTMLLRAGRDENTIEDQRAMWSVNTKSEERASEGVDTMHDERAI